MGSLEERLRKLEDRLIGQPSIDEYLDASNRARVRALYELTEWLAPRGFDGGHLFTEQSLRVIADDTPETRERDREIVEAWHKAQGIERAAELEGAKEKLLAKLEARSAT